MKPETIASARTISAGAVQHGTTCQEARVPPGLGRPCVQHIVKVPVPRVGPERGIPELGEDALSAPSRLRQIREPVLPAAGDFESGQDRPKRSTLGPEEIADGALRQAGSRPAHR